MCCHSFKDKEVQRDSKMVSYDVVDKKGKPNVQVEIGGEKKTFSPEEISAMILGKMKETAGAHHSAFIITFITCLTTAQLSVVQTAARCPCHLTVNFLICRGIPWQACDACCGDCPCILQ